MIQVAGAIVAAAGGKANSNQFFSNSVIQMKPRRRTADAICARHKATVSSARDSKSPFEKSSHACVECPS